IVPEVLKPTIKVNPPVKLQLKTQKVVKPILPASVLDTKTANELEDLFHGYLSESNQITCEKKTRVGNAGDGGWYICDDDGYKPKPPCLTYSFGISTDPSFDLAMKSTYGCEVHSFDPFVTKKQVPHADKLNFHSIGIKDTSNTVNGRKFMTLADTLKSLNHSKRKLDILKMDIEGDEYISLRKAMEDGELDSVKQIMVEFHVYPSKNTGAQNPHRVGLLLLKQLIQYGFRIYLVDRNTACNYKNYKNEILTRCYNIYWLKVN
ncbi:hypothetical protein Ahia01_000632500, partial [Argonauta hians]